MTTAAASRRVVLTGIGLISPLGISNDAFLDGLRSGASGIRPLQKLPQDGLPVDFGGEAREFSGHIENYGPMRKEQTRAIRKGIKLMCREIQMGVAAAQRALVDAGVGFQEVDPDRSGVVYGSDFIVTEPAEFLEAVRACVDEAFEYDRWAETGIPQVTPLWLLKYLPNMPASHVAIYNDFRGPNNSLTMREASPNLALAEARTTIGHGHADLMLAGATGTRLHPLRSVHIAIQEPLAQSPDGDPGSACRPFDKRRTGIVLSEGAAAVVLESLEHAQARGAAIRGEILGAGSSAVADRRGVADARRALGNVLRQCLDTSGLQPDEIDHVHANAAGTPMGDLAEAQAIVDVLGNRSEPVPVMAAKGAIGHVGAAAGMLELIASVGAMEDGTLYPVKNYDEPDPECPVAVVRDPVTPAGTVCINLSITPQGQASGIVFRAGSPA